MAPTNSSTFSITRTNRILSVFDILAVYTVLTTKKEPLKSVV